MPNNPISNTLHSIITLIFQKYNQSLTKNKKINPINIKIKYTKALIIIQDTYLSTSVTPQITIL